MSQNSPKQAVPAAVTPTKQHGWADWSKEALAKEFQTRMAHFYGQTDGSFRLPNSVEGDLLKLAQAYFSKS